MSDRDKAKASLIEAIYVAYITTDTPKKYNLDELVDSAIRHFEKHVPKDEPQP